MPVDGRFPWCLLPVELVAVWAPTGQALPVESKMSTFWDNFPWRSLDTEVERLRGISLSYEMKKSTSSQDKSLGKALQDTSIKVVQSR